jgi:hypothetical protein
MKFAFFENYPALKSAEPEKGLAISYQLGRDIVFS